MGATADPTASPAAGSPAAVLVRTPEPADGGQIGRVHVRAWQRAYTGIMTPAFLDGLDERAWGRAWNRRLLERAAGRGEPGVELLAAERPGTGEVAGVATIGPERHVPERHVPEPEPEGRRSPDQPEANQNEERRTDEASARGEVWMIVVAPDAWGLGVGSALLGEAERRLAARGHRAAVLWVAAGNRRARRFYEHHGWAPDGACRREEIGGGPVDERRYAKTFATPHPGSGDQTGQN